MTTLLLSAAGSAFGGAIGGPLGATLGRSLGNLAGGALDNALFGGGASTRSVEGPRLQEMNGLASTEGAPIPRLYGRARLGGQLIWATRFEEEVTRDVTRSGRSGGKSTPRPKTVTTTYSYYANIAVGLCEGPISFVRRIWADGRELDLSGLTFRFYRGDDAQMPDPLIAAKEGTAPAYRGLAHIVFERLPLGDFGNRVPQFTFEAVRAMDGLPEMIRSVCLIPGSSEFAYDPRLVTSIAGIGTTRPQNRYQLTHETDIEASLDALQALCPSLERVSLVVSWFGDDLRANHCTIAPRVESADKATYGAVWGCAGLARADARLVSLVDGAPAYGGTPSDDGVIRLIQNLKARGLAVVLYPFVMMDIASGNALTNPYADAAGQPAYPWRGRITCDPAPGRSGSPDGGSTASGQVDAFFGSAAAGDFAVEDGAVVYSGPNDWGFRRHILHYAALAKAAGGVDGFIIGSELIGLTRVRKASGLYPAVDALKALAGDVRTILGSGAKLTYAADWTEYGAHVIGGEVRFPLDPLWADGNIDAVGIDYYPPLSDWRDGSLHLDLQETGNLYDVDYLRSRLTAGEAYDWYYASPADREAQIRTPITDGAYAKPWIYRAKDIESWWSNAHIERVAGVETAATGWTARSKPVWLTETGIPAVDKGPNGPNVFPDPKSSEAANPPFSNGARDDLIQRRALEAILTAFDPSRTANPVSPLYGGPMIDPGMIAIWSWDARPFPAFPDFDTIWADGPNWRQGHWLTGRIEGAPLDRLVAAILADFKQDVPGDIPLDGFLDGYVVDRPMSARAALEPLAQVFGFDAAAEAAGLRFRGRGGRTVIPLDAQDFILEKDPSLRLTRMQETELPHQIELGFTEGEAEYRRAVAASRRLDGTSRREARIDFAIVTRREEAQRLAEALLQDAWAGRETAEFALAPHRLELEPGDIVSLPLAGGETLHRVTRIVEGATRRVSTRAVEPLVFETAVTPLASPAMPAREPPSLPGRPIALTLDLAAAPDDPPVLQHLALFADPWPGSMAIWRSRDGASFAFWKLAEIPAMLGRTSTILAPGPVWRWDDASWLEAQFSTGALASLTDMAALANGNLFAVQGEGGWEILSAARAELIGPRRYRLSRFLRGLGGSDGLASRAVPAGSWIVRLDDAVTPLVSSLDDLGRDWIYRIGPAARDYGDPSYIELTAGAGRDALRPFAPVHLKAKRVTGGILLSWIRRTRKDGDSWEPVEVPLGEEIERYEVDILSGGTVSRTLTASTASVLYADADEMSDFGAVQTALSVRVAQMSAVVGRGFQRNAVLTIG